MPSLGFEMNGQNENLDMDHNKQMVQLAINLQKLQMGGYDAQEINPRRSQNVTESVQVPSSEHVAEIVGRQGMYITIIILNLIGYVTSYNGKNISENDHESC